MLVKNSEVVSLKLTRTEIAMFTGQLSGREGGGGERGRERDILFQLSSDSVRFTTK